MKVSVFIDLTRFESISQPSEKSLIGGFTATFSVSSNQFAGEVSSDNCLGGNCHIGCGGGQNVACNTAAGCGVQ